MNILWITLGVLLLVVVVLSLVDIVRRHRSFWGSMAWAALVIVLPFLGSIIYWALRKPDAEELERERLAHEDVRAGRARQPFDSTGMRP